MLVGSCLSVVQKRKISFDADENDMHFSSFLAVLLFIITRRGTVEVTFNRGS